MARSARRRSRARGSGTPADRRRSEPGGGGENGLATAAVEAPSRPTPRPAQPAPRRRRFGFLRRLVPGWLAGIFSELRKIWSELRKVTWPGADDVRYLTIVVTIVAVTIGIFLGAVDILFGWVVEQVFFS